MKDKLTNDIVNTLCYYDALNYPVTSFEIWKYLTRSIDRENDDGKIFIELEEVIKKLESNEIKNVTDNHSGFYVLKGRKELVEKRIQKNKISSLKVKRLRGVARVLRLVPFVRMILVTGKLSMKNATLKSDWDLLVVLEKGRIWTGRTLVTGLVHLMGKRRYGKKVRNRVCLNHFVTTGSLEILDKNLFSANEYMFAVPLFDSGDLFEKFQLKNYWIREMKMNYYINELGHLRSVRETRLSKRVRSVLEKLCSFDFLEGLLRRVEKKKIENNPKTKMKGSFIEASDSALIFLPKPQGPVIFEKYYQTLEKIKVG
jgi:hypothetical protein